MKKKAILILILVLAIGIGAFLVFRHYDEKECYDADNTQSLTLPEQIVDVFIDNKDVWLPNEKYIGTAVFCGFLDLDFDGILELVICETGGSGVYSTNKFYKINQTNKSVCEITLPQGERCKFDLCFPVSTKPKLLKLKDGSLAYFCTDFSQAGMQNSTKAESLLKCNGNTLETQKLFLVKTFIENEENSGYFYYQYDKEYSVDGGSFEKIVDEYLESNNDLNLKWQTRQTSELTDASDIEMRQKLLELYNAFSFDDK